MRFLLSLFLASLLAITARAQTHTNTDWDVRPSLAFDAICALNVLSGDPYYLEYYRADYERLAPQLKPEERSAIANLKHRIKDENGGIISAMLALDFSAANPETLDDLIRIVQDSSEMRRNLQATTYYDDGDWKTYEQSRPDLEIAFRALKRIHFAEDWKANAKPHIDQAHAAIAKDLAKYNVVPAVEGVLGTPRPTNKITVYLLYYSQPHGIKITGARFLTHYSYPFRIVLRNAIHEMMHPPYDLAHDPSLKAGLVSLRSDGYLMDKVEHHDRSFGYNTIEGLEEEDSVQALEQIIAERFGMGGDPVAYWRGQDGGIHVLAVALYSLMKQQDFLEKKESFPTFLKRNLNSDALSNGRIGKLNQAFFATKP
jgi:hypothetical protein